MVEAEISADFSGAKLEKSFVLLKVYSGILTKKKK
jgi:hypothetical protein